MFDGRTPIKNVPRARKRVSGAGSRRMRELALGGLIVGGIILWGAAVISVMIR